MNSTVIVALISFAGTLSGTVGGIIASSKLTAFRIEQLETKLDRQAASVAKIPVIEEKIQNINRRINHFETDSVIYFDGC